MPSLLRSHCLQPAVAARGCSLIMRVVAVVTLALASLPTLTSAAAPLPWTQRMHRNLFGYKGPGEPTEGVLEPWEYTREGEDTGGGSS